METVTNDSVSTDNIMTSLAQAVQRITLRAEAIEESDPKKLQRCEALLIRCQRVLEQIPAAAAAAAQSAERERSLAEETTRLTRDREEFEQLRAQEWAKIGQELQHARHWQDAEEAQFAQREKSLLHDKRQVLREIDERREAVRHMEAALQRDHAARLQTERTEAQSSRARSIQDAVAQHHGAAMTDLRGLVGECATQAAEAVRATVETHISGTVGDAVARLEPSSKATLKEVRVLAASVPVCPAPGPAPASSARSPRGRSGPRHPGSSATPLRQGRSSPSRSLEPPPTSISWMAPFRVLIRVVDELPVLSQAVFFACGCIDARGDWSGAQTRNIQQRQVTVPEGATLPVPT
jgi:hypothetical protein